MQSIFVKRSRPHLCHRLTSQPSTHTNTSLGQRSLTRRRGPASSQERLGRRWAVVVHNAATPCFIVFVKFWHGLRVLHVHTRCFPTVLSGRLPKICCGFCRCRSPLGSCRQTLWWISCASFGSLSCASSVAESLWFPPQHPELDHQLPPHEISTWRSTLPKSALKTLTPCYLVLAKNEACLLSKTLCTDQGLTIVLFIEHSRASHNQGFFKGFQVVSVFSSFSKVFRGFQLFQGLQSCFFFFFFKVCKVSQGFQVFSGGSRFFFTAFQDLSRFFSGGFEGFSQVFGVCRVCQGCGVFGVSGFWSPSSGRREKSVF